MEEIWNNLIGEFCKVEFLCYQGEPNWLGWFVFVFLGFIIFGLLCEMFEGR